MSLLDDVQAALLADAPLVALATGGIVTFDATGRMGLNRTSTPSVFDARGRIKPTVLIKLREAIPDGEAADDVLQAVSARQVVECWLYQDVGYATIEGMAARVYAVLHANHDLETGNGGRYILHWAGNVRPPIRDSDLDANMERSDYRARFINRPTV